VIEGRILSRIAALVSLFLSADSAEGINCCAQRQVLVMELMEALLIVLYRKLEGQPRHI
jgi:hypothetical protein